MKEHGAYLVTFPLFAGIVLAITTIYDISMECAFYVIVFYMICVTGAYLAAYRFYKKQQEEKEAEVTIDKSEDWEKYQESADFFCTLGTSDQDTDCRFKCIASGTGSEYCRVQTGAF